MPGYSTSAFNYQLKKLINDKIYPKKIFVVLDILDVSNEASLWDQKDEYEHPVRVNKNIINVEDAHSLQSFKRKNFKISRLIARSTNNFFRSILRFVKRPRFRCIGKIESVFFIAELTPTLIASCPIPENHLLILPCLNSRSIFSSINLGSKIL